MAQWRKQRASPEDLFAAAESVAQLALHEPPGPARAAMWNLLDELVRLVRNQVAIPSALANSLRALGSPVISKDLSAAQIN